MTTILFYPSILSYSKQEDMLSLFWPPFGFNPTGFTLVQSSIASSWVGCKQGALTSPHPEPLLSCISAQFWHFCCCFANHPWLNSFHVLGMWRMVTVFGTSKQSHIVISILEFRANSQKHCVPVNCRKSASFNMGQKKCVVIEGPRSMSHPSVGAFVWPEAWSAGGIEWCLVMTFSNNQHL